MFNTYKACLLCRERVYDDGWQMKTHGPISVPTGHDGLRAGYERKICLLRSLHYLQVPHLLLFMLAIPQRIPVNLLHSFCGSTAEVGRSTQAD